MAENKIRVELEGKDRSLGRTLRKAGTDATTFRGKLKLIGQGLKQLITGDFRGLGKTLKTLGSGFGGFGRIAAAAITGITVAIGAMIVAVLKAKRTYEDWMQQLDDLQDVTGLNAKTTSLLAFQARMADTDVKALGKGVGIFTKTLDAARQGTEASLAPFERLGIDLKDNEGNFRDLDDVLFEARDRLSEVEDQTTRNGIAAKLFGRGFAELADWLDKPTEKMREYMKWAEQLGMVMGEKSMTAFQKYRENQRKVSVGWDAIKINAYGALVPLINDLMPHVIGLIWKGANWVAKFRRAVEKKGWGRAIHEMVPELEDVWDLLKKAWDYAKKFGAYIVEHKEEIADAFRAILKVINAIATAINAAITAAEYLASIDFSGKGGSGSHREGTHSGSSATSGAQRTGGRRALGGVDVVTAPTSFLFGESGPETVVSIPHDRTRRAGDIMDKAGLMPSLPSVTIPIFLDGKLIARYVVDLTTGKYRVALREGAA